MAGLQLPNTATNRLELIEEMIADGRRTTEGWGAPFVLWGLGHLAGIAVMAWWHTYWCWYVILPVCFVASLVLLHRHTVGKRTFAGRAIHAVWIAELIGLSICDLVALPSGKISWDGYDLFFLCSMGACTYVNGVVLRWPVCVALGFVWWGAAVVGLLLPGRLMGLTWIIATAVLQLGFGVYLVIRDARRAGQEA